MIKTVNPFSEKKIREYQELSVDNLNNAAVRSHNAFLHWKDQSVSKRTNLLKIAAGTLRNNQQFFAELITEEMGKPIKQSIAEIEKSAWVCDYYADNASPFLVADYFKAGATESFVKYQPIGPILAIMPWNFPFWQVFRFAAPNLAAGNTGLLKHSANTTGCSIAIEEVFRKAGFPEDVFISLVVSSKPIEKFMENKHIKGVTLTGSTPVGKKVAAKAGSLIKKTVLELGGSDPYVILKDADLDKAVEACTTSRMTNSGQSCIAAKRFIVDEKIYDEFTEKLTNRIKQEKTGDPNDPNTTVGPIARKDLRDELHEQVTRSIDKGAKLLTGGNIPGGKGYFYEPTVLIDIPEDSPAYNEELFGPVAAVIKAKNRKHAVEIANATDYGLGAAIFSEDIPKARETAFQIDAGCCFINDFVKSDPRLPFGGVKESGYGRELSLIGFREFLNAKTISIK